MGGRLAPPNNKEVKMNRNEYLGLYAEGWTEGDVGKIKESTAKKLHL